MKRVFRYKEGHVFDYIDEEVFHLIDEQLFGEIQGLSCKVKQDTKITVIIEKKKG